MKLKLRTVAAVLLIWFISIPAAPVALPEMQSLLSKARIRTDELGILILDEENEIYSLNDTRKLKVASLSKVITGAAVLEMLGTSFQFRTKLLFEGSIEENTLYGSLYLESGGDPSFTSAKLLNFITALKNYKINKIDGNIVVDDSRFQDIRDPNWMKKTTVLNPRMYPLFVNLDPPAGKPLSASSWKKARRSSRKFSELTGKFVVYKNMSEPDLWTANDFLRLLQAHKIKVTGKLIRGTIPEDARLLSDVVSPLTEIVLEMTKSSDNFYADMLVRNLAAELSDTPDFETGLNHVRSFLDQLQIARTEYSINSGSGFSHQNLISARALSKLLNHLKNTTNGSSVLMSYLPVAGVDGTLKYRMRKTVAHGRVQAKTGYLRSLQTRTIHENGAVALAGYATRTDGKMFTFVLLYNGRGNPYTIRNFFDSICVKLMDATFPSTHRASR